MVRCVVRPEQVRQGVVTLDPRQTKHVATVLRLRAGDEFVIMTGAGAPQVAQLETVRGSRASARLLRPAPTPPPEPWVVSLAAAVPRHPAAFDQIVDQAVQVGAARILPMVTARSVARVEPARAATRHRRWRHLAEAAAEQSGRATIPTVELPATLPEILAQRAQYDRLLIPTVGAPWTPVADWLRPPIPRRVLLLVGPEGDFTPEEIQQASAAGAIPISLGDSVLRCETASTVALALLTHTLRCLAEK